MTQIATEDTFVVVDGIRRKIAKGAPIPGYLATQADVEQETVEARSLSAPVVDEEASLSQAERAKRAAGGGAKASTSGSAKKPASGSASGS